MSSIASFLALVPDDFTCVFLQVLQVNLKSDFFEVFAPVLFHAAIAFLENFPWFPNPAFADPLFVSLAMEPFFSVPLSLVLARATVCSV